MLTTELIVGDWGGDGHGRSRAYHVSHNLCESNLRKAYLTGSNKLAIEMFVVDPESYPKMAMKPATSIDVMAELVADDFEDCSMPKSVADALIANGIMPNPSEYDEYDTKEYFDFWILNDDGTGEVEGSEGYVRLWLAIAKLGNPNLIWQFNKFEKIDIGGYGVV